MLSLLADVLLGAQGGWGIMDHGYHSGQKLVLPAFQSTSVGWGPGTHPLQNIGCTLEPTVSIAKDPFPMLLSSVLLSALFFSNRGFQQAKRTLMVGCQLGEPSLWITTTGLCCVVLRSCPDLVLERPHNFQIAQLSF